MRYVHKGHHFIVLRTTMSNNHIFLRMDYSNFVSVDRTLGKIKLQYLFLVFHWQIVYRANNQTRISTFDVSNLFLLTNLAIGV